MLRDDAVTEIAPPPAVLPEPPAPDVLPVEVPGVVWSPLKKGLFRFLFCYLVLFIAPFPFNVIPGMGAVNKAYESLWQALVPWVAKLLFHLKIDVFPNGSGDTTFNYVELFVYLVLAAAAALVWSLLDRRRPNYARLYAWLRAYVRFDLAITMFIYGIDKVIQLQFPSPSPNRLLETFGESSPMGLLWTFMGASTLYTFFGGASEVLGGLLLTLRRTTLLGAIVCIGVITNIVMLNFSYDVPVKIFSTHLLGMAVFLAAHDARRLADLFLLNRPVPPAADVPLFRRRWSHQGTLVLRTLLVVAFLGSSFYEALEANKKYGEGAPKPPLYGVWEVDEMVSDGHAVPPLLTDPARLRRVVFAYPGYVAFEPMVAPKSRYESLYTAAIDPKAKTLTLSRDPKEFPQVKVALRTVLTYAQSSPDRLVIDGPFAGHRIHLTAHQQDPKKFLLVNRGFHWINERPYNR
jgi:hypothetical protein